jgi:hypothetical protein
MDWRGQAERYRKKGRKREREEEREEERAGRGRFEQSEC